MTTQGNNQADIPVGTRVEILVGGFSGEYGQVVEVMGVNAKPTPYPIYTVKTDSLRRLPGYRANQLRVLWIATKPNTKAEVAH